MGKVRYNIFRRIVRIPGAMLIGMFGSAWIITHYALYRGNDWANPFGWKMYHVKPSVVPGSVHWPAMEAYKRPQKKDYGCFGFDEEKDGKAIVTSVPVSGYASG